ncbi:MAG TPA: alginate lyase family protein [Blastocatellia bacterium]|nr:alginate lyase family protein [Blastocatellia bacterium]
MQHPTFFHVEAAVRIFKTTLLLILACGVAQAQNFQATVVGHVVDANGAAVVGAKVIITAQGTSRIATATTSSDGGFTIPQLPPGVYDLRIEANGFKSAVKSNLALETGQTQRVSFQLETGVVSDTVTISTEAPPINTDTSGKGEVIVSRHFIKVVDAAGLLGGSRAWTDKDERALAAWFRQFANWMQSSSNGKDEAQAKNNHGSWYAAQLACFALFIGDKELARKTAEAARDRIAWQVEPDGKQPHELQRTRALGYSAFNLVALMTLAEAGKRVGVDLYAYQTKDGRSIRLALDYLTPYADAAREWPHQQINEMENARRDLAYLLRRASIAFREAQYEELLEKHLASEAAQQRWQLLWPR